MTQQHTATDRYPNTISLDDDRSLSIEMMTADHRDAVLAFARSLPEDDLLFLRIDITQPGAVDDWVEQLENGMLTSIVALENDNVVGYATVQQQPTRWTRRVGEIRVNVGPEFRRIGLGRSLMGQIFDLAQSFGLKKLMANMTLDQRQAQSAFRRLGFVPEAVLADFVEDRNGVLHDMVIMTYDVDGLSADSGAPLRV